MCIHLNQARDLHRGKSGQVSTSLFKACETAVKQIVYVVGVKHLLAVVDSLHMVQVGCHE